MTAMAASGTQTLVAGVVIPAHNEAAVIGRNLRLLVGGLEPGGLEILVVCNGCTDDTAAVARGVPGVRVLEIADASKALALAAGDQVCTTLPRVRLDADCVMSGPDVIRLVEALRDPAVLAVAPERILDLTGSSWLVRQYYRVWEQLPQVRNGLFGRGVIALSAEGQARVDALPHVMGDDLAVSEAFAPSERRIVTSASVVVRAPGTVRDLLRRRTRVATGNSQIDSLGLRRPDSATGPRTLVAMCGRSPSVALRLPVFIAVGLVGRALSRASVRRGDYTTWLRDESSRR